MKAPDKIFRTTTYLDNDKGKVVWKETPVNGAENIAYIRKDALLEWAKEHKCAIETHGDERDAYSRGEYSVLNFLIDKLNSM